jgi:phosphoribosylanthranilate isomerase
VKQIIAALPRNATPVGVFVNPSRDDIHHAADAGIRIAQIHGDATPGGLRAGIEVIRAVHLVADGRSQIEPDVPEGKILLDAFDPARHGGTGKTIDWARAGEIAKTREIFLAGGLTPDNVRHAIARVKPFAVDVASGVEAAPGVKDHEKLRALFAAVKESV